MMDTVFENDSKSLTLQHNEQSTYLCEEFLVCTNDKMRHFWGITNTVNVI